MVPSASCLKCGNQFSWYGSRARKWCSRECAGTLSKRIPLDSVSQLLDGLMLGDGSLWAARTRPNSNACYRQSSISKDWLDHLVGMFSEAEVPSSVYFVRTYQHKNGDTSDVWFLQTASSCSFTELRERWYPQSKKRCPMDFEVTKEVALQWYLGDGCLRHGWVTLCTEGYSKLEIEWLHDQLESKIGEGTVRLAKRRASFNLEMTIPGSLSFLKWIGSCPVPSLEYKWGSYCKEQSHGG